ncbi:MAG TPA: outer membrane beta-barrel protein [Chryseolinea sp.]|nr:outer membrane beta-barrel protein [Chryseolinea sp.]
MRLFIYICLCLLPLKVSGQTDNARALSIGLFYSPGVSYRQLNFSSTDGWIEKVRNGDEIPKYSFSTGAKIGFTIRDRVRVVTGLMFTNRGERTKETQLTWPTSSQAYPQSSRSVFSYRYLELPLQVMYAIHKKQRLGLYLIGGVSFNLLLNKATKVELEFPDGDRQTIKSSKSAGNNRFGLCTSFGLEASYKLTDKISLLIGPTFHRSITSAVVNKNAKEYQYAVFMTVGLVKMFQR